jgi:hypothetical protein
VEVENDRIAGIIALNRDPLVDITNPDEASLVNSAGLGRCWGREEGPRCGYVTDRRRVMLATMMMLLFPALDRWRLLTDTRQHGI